MCRSQLYIATYNVSLDNQELTHYYFLTTLDFKVEALLGISIPEAPVAAGTLLRHWRW